MRILVNCALPYANAPLHLGHLAGAYLAADIFVRYNRLIGNEVLYICGTDEYGTAITLKADREGITPREVADRFHTEHSKTFRSLQIDFDLFSRTTYDEHKETVQEFFLDLYEKKYLEVRKMISSYCPHCKKFRPDRYIVGTCPNCGFTEARGDQCDNCGKILDPQDLVEPKCSICGTEPEFPERDHFFFRLDMFSDQLRKWLSEKSFWKNHVLEFAKGLVSAGLKPRPITRDITWGVPVPLPGYEDKVLYVWFDNLIGYVSASRILSKQRADPDLWKRFWLDKEVKSYYFMGKDNITFHAIIWPAMLMGRGNYNLPYDIPANEYLNFESQKMSKSRGIGFTVDSVLNKVGSNFLRFYVASVLPETGDSNFDVDEMQDKINSELISKYGNLVHRIVSFVSSNDLEPMGGTLDEDDSEILSAFRSGYEQYSKHLSSVEIKKALHVWIDLTQQANAYVNRSEPWKLIKTDRSRCAAKIHIALNLAHVLTVMIYPYIPSASESILKILGLKGSIVEAYSSMFQSDNAYRPVRSDPPFRKLEISDINPNDLDLTVGKIVEVKDHPEADRLYVLLVSLGDRKIQLVAGLKKHYKIDHLKGRKIIVVANLKKGRIRGQDSEGMLLAADDGTRVHFLTIDEKVPEGSSVSLGQYPYNGKKTVTVEDLARYGLSVNEDSSISANLGEERVRLQAGRERVFPESETPAGSRVR